MFNTKNLVHEISSVPTPWIFEHFCGLKEKLSGQDIKIKSLFNTNERTASMSIYLDPEKNIYKYKDFSSGKGGSAIGLIMELFSTTYSQAIDIIIEQYNDYVLHNNGGYDLGDFKVQSKYKVAGYTLRGWDQRDKDYWTQFNISSKILDKYNVKPLKEYMLYREDPEGGDNKELVINGLYTYGFFKKNGDLYKIYQPKTKDKKFIKVKDYIQGQDQLAKRDCLLITSSLKDIMSIDSFGLTIDMVAPDSENTMIKKDAMERYLEDYSKVLILLDNDEPGIAAMKKYKAQYPDITICLLPMSKDPSDSIRDFGARAVRERLVPIINSKIENIEPECKIKLEAGRLF